METKYGIGDIVRIPFKVRKIEISNRYDQMAIEYTLEPVDESQRDLMSLYFREEELETLKEE